MFETKPFESKAQPDIETSLRQGFEQLSGAALFYGLQVRLDILEKEDQKFIRQRVLSEFGILAAVKRYKGPDHLSPFKIFQILLQPPTRRNFGFRADFTH